jgi:hypothetical protein
MKLPQWIVGSSVVACVIGPVTGCSVIGHSVGQGIDGPMFKHVNSVTATREIDSSGGVPHTRFRFDNASLAQLLKKASADDEGIMLRAASKPGLGFVDSVRKTQVEIITTYIDGDFSGRTCTLDTVLAAELPSSSPRRYGLLAGEQITLQFKDRDLAQIQGSVVRFGENHVVLNTGEQKRGYPFALVDSIFLRHGSTSTRLGPEFLKRHIVRVPCLLLADQPEFMIPLEDVEQISVRVLDQWGPWSTRLAIAGGVVDLGLVVGLVILVADLPSGQLFPSGSL